MLTGRKQETGNRKQAGFTLIELLVVISIIGVLSLLTVSNLNNTRRKARDAERKTELKTIQTALESYYGDNNQYPATLALLITAYLPSQPNDPLCPSGSGSGSCAAGQWTDYVYETCDPAGTCPSASGTPQGYRIYSRLENTSDPEGMSFGSPATLRYSLCGGVNGSHANCSPN